MVAGGGRQPEERLGHGFEPEWESEPLDVEDATSRYLTWSRSGSVRRTLPQRSGIISGAVGYRVPMCRFLYQHL